MIAFSRRFWNLATVISDLALGAAGAAAGGVAPGGLGRRLGEGRNGQQAQGGGKDRTAYHASASPVGASATVHAAVTLQPLNATTTEIRRSPVPIIRFGDAASALAAKAAAMTPHPASSECTPV
ncbi:MULTISPECIES: hypothetical protein [unclassified Mesorhizobium]|uniref:hypothetical protein n=1 Tax=unclassified Mesorhizobium TaxID=325217 RepID=UPI001FF0404D|nr:MULTISPECIES: hypothetical protein [unclassified Mesorhizobium]